MHTCIAINSVQFKTSHEVDRELTDEDEVISEGYSHNLNANCREYDLNYHKEYNVPKSDCLKFGHEYVFKSINLAYHHNGFTIIGPRSLLQVGAYPRLCNHLTTTMIATRGGFVLKSLVLLMILATSGR